MSGQGLPAKNRLCPKGTQTLPGNLAERCPGFPTPIQGNNHMLTAERQQLAACRAADPRGLLPAEIRHRDLAAAGLQVVCIYQ